MTLSYILAIILGLLAAYFLNNAAPTLNPFVKFFIVPFLVIFPGINRFGKQVSNYVAENTAQDIHAMSYVEIFPPIFAVFIIIVVLLYSGLFK